MQRACSVEEVGNIVEEVQQRDEFDERAADLLFVWDCTASLHGPSRAIPSLYAPPRAICGKVRYVLAGCMARQRGWCGVRTQRQPNGLGGP